MRKELAQRLVAVCVAAAIGTTVLAAPPADEPITGDKGSDMLIDLVVMRPIVSVGKEMGWLPGDVNEKIHPWMKPIFDNVQFLLGDDKKDKTDKTESAHGHHALKLQQLLEQGVIDTVRRGGDTATNAAIAGALLSRRDSGSPGRW